MKTQTVRSNNILTYNLSEPLNGTKTASIDVNSASGNLSINPLTSGASLLVSGTLEYGEKQGLPILSLVNRGAHASVTLNGKDPGKPWFRFPWSACNGATDWQIHLNPAVSYEIDGKSGGGNININLAGMQVRNVSAETGGGNIGLILPRSSAELSVSATTGAGNVDIFLPDSLEAKVHATSGLGKVILDSRFTQVDKNTYQTSGYASAASKVEITAKTGAGNVSISAVG